MRQRGKVWLLGKLKSSSWIIAAVTFARKAYVAAKKWPSIAVPVIFTLIGLILLVPFWTLVEANSEVIRNIAFILAGIWAVYGVWIAARRVDIQERGQVAERVARAAEQLDSKSDSVRMVAVLALQKVAKEADTETSQDIIRTFCAYVKELRPYSPENLRNEEDSGSEEENPSTSNPRNRGPFPAYLKQIINFLGELDNEQRMIGGEGLVDLSNTDLIGVNLNGKNFSSSNLVGANLEEENLTGANLAGADLTGANLEMADLTRANLEMADLTRANLEMAHLTGANLEMAGLTRANLEMVNLTMPLLGTRNDQSDTNLSNANLSSANLSGADLIYANLSRADLKYANLSRADLEHVNLSRADLRHANLSRADLEHANLSRADLEHANLESANLTEVNLEGATTTFTKGFETAKNVETVKNPTPEIREEIKRRQMWKTNDLSFKNLIKADLRYADLTRKNLTGADLTEANLESADLTKANLEGATTTFIRGLESARYIETVKNPTPEILREIERRQIWEEDDLSSKNLIKADLRHADLTRKNLTGADLTGANLESANLTGADLIGADMGGAITTLIQGLESTRNIETVINPTREIIQEIKRREEIERREEQL